MRTEFKSRLVPERGSMIGPNGNGHVVVRTADGTRFNCMNGLDPGEYWLQQIGAPAGTPAVIVGHNDPAYELEGADDDRKRGG